MRRIGRAIDRFCIKRPRFGIPGLMRFIVFGTGLVFIFSLMDTTGGDLVGLLFFSPTHILQGQVWRLFSFIFVPWTSSPLWLFVMLYVYYMLGTFLERAWGTSKFTIYYFSSMILLTATAFVFHLFGFFFSFLFVSVNHINLTLLLAFATMQPDMEFRLFFVIPIRAKWVGIVAAAFFLYGIFSTIRAFPVNLIPLVVLLNYWIFCGDTLLYHLGFLKSRVVPSKAAINFKKAAKKVRKNQKDRLYTRKCAVCGKTDTQYPDMEFRFCSKCEGYHCFCLEHINNHVHFQ